jgi:uncharacterized repeat protein (TIGR04042 family)
MPEVTFRIRWPDGVEEDCYSPSTVIHDHLKVGHTYSVDDFYSRTSIALDKAAKRVEAKYGFRCTSADAQAARIATAIARYKSEDTVTCLSLR